MNARVYSLDDPVRQYIKFVDDLFASVFHPAHVLPSVRRVTMGERRLNENQYGIATLGYEGDAVTSLHVDLRSGMKLHEVIGTYAHKIAAVAADVSQPLDSPQNGRMYLVFAYRCMYAIDPVVAADEFHKVDVYT